MTMRTTTQSGISVCHVSDRVPSPEIRSMPRSRERRSGDPDGSCAIARRFMAALLFGPSEEPRQERLEAEEAAEREEEVLPDRAGNLALRRGGLLALAGQVEREIREAAPDLLGGDFLQVPLAPDDLLRRGAARGEVRREVRDELVLAPRVGPRADERVA